MSATAISMEDTRVARFWSASNGKKIVMAVSGVVLFLFIVGHMLGNLQIFLGPQRLNDYAHFLKHGGLEITWTVRAVLIVLVILHIWAAFALWLQKRRARPIKYVKKDNIDSTYASRTMYWSGPIILAFVIYHLMEFTWGVGWTKFVDADVYATVVAGFQVPIVSGFYIFALALLCLHLYHGVWSMFQSVGLNHPRYTPLLRRCAKAIAVLIFAGYISIPVAVLAGVLR